MATVGIKNYHKAGGKEWVVNGTLTYGPDAVVNLNGAAQDDLGDQSYAAGALVTVDSESKTGNSVSSDKMLVRVTSGSLTTAAGATQNIVVTNANAAAGDHARADIVGGSNTRNVMVLKTVVTSTTITVTLLNFEASNALNGTVIVDVRLEKAPS